MVKDIVAKIMLIEELETEINQYDMSSHKHEFMALKYDKLMMLKMDLLKLVVADVLVTSVKTGIKIKLWKSLLGI